jgi:hypothetical protein
MKTEDLKNTRNAIVLSFNPATSKMDISDSEILCVLRSSVKENWTPEYHLSLIEPVDEVPHAFVCLYEGDGYMDFGEFINPADFLSHEQRFKWNYCGFGWIEDFLQGGICCCNINYSTDSTYSTYSKPDIRGKSYEKMQLLERLTLPKSGPEGTMNEVQILELIGEDRFSPVETFIQEIDTMYILYLDRYIESVNEIKNSIRSGGQIDCSENFNCKYYNIKDPESEISKVEQIEKLSSKTDYFYMKGIYQGESIIFTVDHTIDAMRIGAGDYSLRRLVKTSPAFDALSFIKKENVIRHIIGSYATWNEDIDRYG